jgi:hypothetical protein
MLTTGEETQISETTTSFRITIDNVGFEKTLDECYERRRNYGSESKPVRRKQPDKKSPPKS